MSWLWTRPLARLVVIGVALLLGIGIVSLYQAGHTAGKAACEAAHTKAAQEAQEAQATTVRELKRAIAQGQDALHQAQQQSAAFASTITQEVYRADRPALAVCAPAPRQPHPRHAAAQPRGEGVGQGLVLEPVQTAEQRTAEAEAPAPGAGGDGVRLTAHAVRLWDSALAGADVPRAGCTAADPTAPACAADAGVTLADALANHATNAALCAQDRANLLQLQAAVHRIRGTAPPGALSPTDKAAP